jgi:hypothetical protein
MLYKKEKKSNTLRQKDIPDFPERIIFGRSNIKSVAIKRLETLDQYCKVNSIYIIWDKIINDLKYNY